MVPAPSSSLPLAEATRLVHVDGQSSCLEDATSIRGLATLVATYPTLWDQLLRVTTRRPGRDPTFAEWLRTACPDLFPTSKKNRRFRVLRAVAARWMPHLDGVRVARIDETTLARIVDRRLVAGVTGATSTWKADCSRLRAWVRAAQASIGCHVAVAKRWLAIPGGGVPSEGDGLRDPRDVLELIAATPDPLLRVMIGFSFGCRLATSEIEALRAEDFAPDYSNIGVREGSRRGRPRAHCGRVVALPRWLRDLAEVAWGPAPPSGGWLFPAAGSPSKHRVRTDSLVRKLGRSVGRETASFAGIRRIGQSIAREFHGSRVLVRGVSRRSRRGVIDPEEAQFAKEQAALAEAWPVLISPPATAKPLPLRAPKRCSPEESELEAARRSIHERFRPVPPRAQLRGLPYSCTGPGDGLRYTDERGVPDANLPVPHEDVADPATWMRPSPAPAAPVPAAQPDHTARDISAFVAACFLAYWYARARVQREDQPSTPVLPPVPFSW